MSERGRYDYDITTGERGYGSSGGRSSRSSGSMFDMGSSRERSRGRDEDGHRMGGQVSSGRTSSHDRDEDQRGQRWVQERENFSWGGGRDRHRERDSRDDRHMQEHHGSRDQGERMSSGWGGLAGEQIGPGRMDHDQGHGREHERVRRHDNDRHDEHHSRRSERSQGYGRDDHRDGLPIEETSRLIASNKVEGTAVYGRDGHRLGSIYNFMVDKLSGHVEYAIMAYGGMLGMGQRYYPLPWDILTYDTREGGYRIEMTERDLRDAPSFDRDTEPQFNSSYGEHVNSWHGVRRR